MRFSVLCLSLLFFLCSCTENTDTDTITNESITTFVDEQNKNLDSIIENANSSNKTLEDISKSNDNITQEANKLETENLSDNGKKSLKTILESSSIIDKSVFTIASFITNIKSNSQETKDYSKDILEKIKQTNKYVAKLEKLQEENQQLKKEAQSKLYGYLTAFFGIGLATIVAGFVVMFFVEKKLGLTISAIGLFTFAFAAASTFYLNWIALVGIIITISGLLFAVGLLIYHLTKGKKEINTLSTATEQTVELVEALKQNLDPKSKVEFFGDKAMPGIAQAIQDEKTQNIVRNIREVKLKPKINPTI